MSPRAERTSLRGQFKAPEQGAEASEHRPNSLISRAAVLVTPELRHAMISEAAYYLAQHRGFEAGQDWEDWLRAESQIDAALAHDALPD
jgi:hypothetical protein